VPGGWTIQEERGDGVATWRLRDKAWRNGGGSSGLYAVTVSVSTAEPGAEAEKLFRDTVEHFKTKVLADAAVTGEGTAAFADRQFLQADIAGTLDAKTDTPHPAVLRVMTDKQGDKLVVVTAFASPDAAAQLGMAVAPAGLVAPLAAQ